MSLVEVTDLSISFGDVQAVSGLSFSLEAGGALGIVGESGSGKSASAYALLGLHRGTGARVGGSVRVAGVDVQTADDAELRGLRGAKAAMVFQDPLSSLDPYYAVGAQIARSTGSTTESPGGRRGPGPSRCWTGSAFPTRHAAPGPGRTSSPAGCGNGR